MPGLSDLSIKHDSLISLHVQLHNQLRHLILSGRWPYGTRVPSEYQLVQHLGISRSTVRLALQMAEVEGLIERTRGRGTFVAYRMRAAAHLIAFVATDLNTDYQVLLLKGAESEARANGYRIIFNNAADHAEEMRILETLHADRVAGVLLWPRPLACEEANREQYKYLDLPMILLDRPIPGLDYPCITSDSYNGAARLVQYLLNLGHRRIAYLSHHELHLQPVADRLRAYRDMVRAAGLEPLDPWLIGDPNDEIGSHHVLQAYDDAEMPMLKKIQAYMQQDQPTAIFAVNDQVAALAVRALRLLGLRIPDDVSVAGFDDADLSVYMDVPLTTVAQDTFEIGRRAAQFLINQIENTGQPEGIVFIPTQLRVRASTAVPVAAEDPERR